MDPLPNPSAQAETQAQELPKLLKIPEFYEALDKTVGINSLREAVRLGRIKSVAIGNKRLIPRSEVEAWPLREAGLN